MIQFLIYLSTFGCIYTFSYILLGDVAPFIFRRYSQLQMRRTENISRKLEEDFIFLQKRKKILLSFSPLICMGLGFILLRNPLGLIGGFFCGTLLPVLMVNMARQLRVKRFRGQLVDSLMILSSCLKGGLSFLQAMEILVDEMPPPVSQEFNLVLKENKLGINLEESLRRLRRRMPLEEVNLLISSILVARETGGELTRVFSRLTETIRNNIKLKEKIGTLTLQGRLQGIIMAALPIVFTCFIYRQDPRHFDIMWQSDLGKILIIGAIVAQIVGMYLIKRISTLRV